MPNLNAEQRQKLLNELSGMNFNKAKAKLRSLDQKNRLVFFRNAQGVGRWMTRYDLPTLGTRVTLVETHQDTANKGKLRSEFELSEISVEPLPGNVS